MLNKVASHLPANKSTPDALARLANESRLPTHTELC